MTTSRHAFRAIDGAALIVANVVGAGIFIVPAYVARLAGSADMALALWVAGGLIALLGALCYAELASRFARGGAEYVYITRAFGPTAGFLSGWTSFIAGFSGAVAAAAVGFAEYLAPITDVSGREDLVAVTTIALCTLIALGGVRASAWATNGLAGLVVIGALVVAIAGAGAPSPVQPTAAAAAPVLYSLSALVPIFFTYSGWNAAAYVAGEFSNPTRDVPRALLWGTLAVTALYVGLNSAILHVMPIQELTGSGAPVLDAAQRLLGSAGGIVVGALVLVALSSSVCAMMIAGPRIYREMARDGALPELFGRLNSRGAPATSVVAQGAWASVLVLTGTFESIVSYTGFAVMLFSALAVASLIVLRRRDGLPAGFRVPAYPVIPVLFLAIAAVMTVSAFTYATKASLVGSVLILSGIGVFRATRGRTPQ